MNPFKNKTEKQIIQEIHDSFDNAQDELLRQATFIIEKHQPSLNKQAETLEKLGFIKSKTVLKNLKTKKIILKSKEDADLVNHYKTSYPFLKFLKEEQLDTICEKYNLIYAPVGRYKEDVPEKNVYEIENAQPLKENDIVEEILEFHGKPEFHEWMEKVGFTNSKTTLKNYQNKVAELYKHKYCPKDWKDPRTSTTGLFVISENIDGYRYFDKITTINKSGLFIAAPKSHFDLDKLNEKGFGFFKITQTEVKDPIVFRYVQGGIQVLSKWGLEADDEMLTQENLN